MFLRTVKNNLRPKTVTGKQADYCFESTVSEERTHWVLWRTWWTLRKILWDCFGTQVIGWGELTELSSRSSVSLSSVLETVPSKTVLGFGKTLVCYRGHLGPSPSNPCFFRPKKGKEPPKTRVSLSTQPLKSLEKKGKTHKKARKPT